MQEMMHGDEVERNGQGSRMKVFNYLKKSKVQTVQTVQTVIGARESYSMPFCVLDKLSNVTYLGHSKMFAFTHSCP